MTQTLKRKKSNIIKPTPLGRIFDVFNITGLILFSLATTYPLWFSVIVSLNDGVDAMRGGIYLWPRVFTLESYKIVFSDTAILRAFAVSIARVVFGASSTVIFTAMVSYPMSKKWLIGRKYYMLFGLFTMFFGAGLIPNLINLRNLGLYDSFLVYIIPGLFSYYNMLIFISFFKGLPDSLEEAAKIDGASDLKVFLRIVLPLSTPVVATIGLFSAVSHWNSYFDGLIYVRNQDLIPVQTYLYNLLTKAAAAKLVDRAAAQAGVEVGKMVLTPSLRYATIVIVMIPILLTYPILQKHFVKGVMIGSIKG